MNKSRKIRIKAFTLIEMLVVLTIIGILLSFIAPMVLDRPNQARQLKAQNDLQAIKAALLLYYIDNGKLPSEAQGLEILSKNSENGIYLKDQPIDPWGNSYQYRVRTNGETLVLSFGPNGEVGGQDDIEIEVQR
ncbi:type II secretion system major pseudopilin GspG [Alphaproteobacteria bacterium]|jgi:general secretion pathway protein G|nr:type II secretion system major pseudopilin GspG [Alphaproteobacteria bacterium]